jgi:hypothetical protein
MPYLRTEWPDIIIIRLHERGHFMYGGETNKNDHHDDVLIFRGSAVAQVMERDMDCFTKITSNPHLLILSSNGNVEGMVADFTPAAFDSPVAGMKI